EVLICANLHSLPSLSSPVLFRGSVSGDNHTMIAGALENAPSTRRWVPVSEARRSGQYRRYASISAQRLEGRMQTDFNGLQIEVFRCHLEGRYAEALALLDESTDHVPEDAMVKLALWRACLLALEGRC